MGDPQIRLANGGDLGGESTRESYADVAVIGAGIAGLLCAIRLAEAGRSVLVLEARDRVGGRCFTQGTQGATGVQADLGAAWHWEEHTRVPPLLEEFGLERVRQHEPGVAIYEPQRDRPVQRFTWPQTPPPSWRIQGGTQALAQELAQRLPAETIRLRHRVTRVEQTASGVAITSACDESQRVVRSERVVCTVPPRLAGHSITFDPALPASLSSAMKNTPTWMSHSAKAAVIFDRPFWRFDGLAGRIRSFAGPVTDWHDATPPEAVEENAPTVTGGALFGFGPPGAFRDRTDSEIRAAITGQLVHCFGPDATNPRAIHWHDWSDDPATTPEAGSACRGEHPRPKKILAEAWWNGRLRFAGAETAHEHPGFLDGAIEAATRCVEAIKQP